MSPSTLRRYRAERLLRAEFERMRASVLAGVSSRLRAAGVSLDASDLDACYAQAWQGLYAAVLDGQEIADPAAWLVRVSYRRAIDEHRSRGRVKRLAPRARGAHTARSGGPSHADAAELAGLGCAEQADIAERLDDRTRLRHVFEALRTRLSVREREAATLCYLQGLSRAEAAARMGVSERRMHKLMDGRGDGSPGVAQKVGALVETIDAGRWCDEQGSLMRGFAYGILDPAGERYRIAAAHRSECSACRAYVLSLRGLAAVLPPAPSLLHLVLGSGAIGGAAAAGSAGAGAGAASAPGATSAAGASASGAGTAGAANGAGAAVGASSGATVGALSSGAAGGGWWIAGGSLGAKLAVGCVLALGVGAGCVALGGHVAGSAPSHRRHARSRLTARRATPAPASIADATPPTLAAPSGDATPTADVAAPARSSAPAPARQAAREFGPEQPGGTSAAPAASATPAALAHTASAGVASAGSESSTSSAPSSAASSASASVPAAQREFAPG